MAKHMACPESPRVAVVGCGQWGQNLVRDFANLQVLDAVVDGIPSRADEVAVQLLRRGYAVEARDWAIVLADGSITAVALATPALQHADMAVAALGAGKHVFIEKPLALTVADGERIRDAALKAGKVAMVGHCFQYHPAFLALKALVDQGKLGRILHIHSRRLGFGRIRHEEDVFWNLAPHDISMILALVGQGPTVVQARGERHLRSHIADVASADLTFANGVHVQILVSWIYPEKERKMIVVGERAMAVFDDCAPWEKKLRVFHHKVDWTNGLPEPAKGEVEGVTLDAREPLADECRHFVECIHTGEQPLTNIDEGLSVVRVLCAVGEAMHHSHATRLTLLDPRPPVSSTSDMPIREPNGTEDRCAVPGAPSKPNDNQALLAINGTLEPAVASARGAISLVDLAAQRRKIQKNLSRRLAKVLDNLEFIMGPEVGELEGRLCAYSGAAHAVTCASGTDALTLALLALQVRRGNAVLVPSLTFVATVEPVVLVGAVPIIVDVDPDTLTIDPALIDAGVEAARNAGLRPVGVIAVDLFGHPADYDALSAATTRNGLWVVADAAQSFGASANGRRVGTLADITTTSFFPSKPLGCYGDGGAVLTDDAETAAVLRSLRLHGRGEDKFDNVRVGLNSRLDTLQAAVLLCKLDILAEEIALRQQVASSYVSLLHGIDKMRLPVLREGVVSAWAAYTLRTTERPVIQARLRAQGIASAVYYPRPIHKQIAYQGFPVANGSCPVAERACSEVLSLPMHPYLEDGIQERIVATIIKDNLKEAPRCPLPNVDKGVPSQTDEAVPCATWDELRIIIETNNLSALKRTPSDLRRYRKWADETKAEYGSLLNYLLAYRLPKAWGTPPFLPVSATPFENPADYRVLMNDWPYGFPPDIVHMVVWTRTTITADSDEGDMTPESREAVANFVKKYFTDRLGPGAGDRVMWFKNWGTLQSVSAVQHIHVVVRDVDPVIVEEWTREREWYLAG